MLPTALPAPFSATLSPALSAYLCTNVGPQGLLVLGLPAPFVPHSASLSPATARGVLFTPVPVSAPPTGLDECLFFISLVSDPLTVGFSVSSGCARRRSVSTYATILVPQCAVIVGIQWRRSMLCQWREHGSVCQTRCLLCDLGRILSPV